MRRIERRLERVFVTGPSKAFQGSLHPAELAAIIARQADLSRFQHATGPGTANRYHITVPHLEPDTSVEEIEGDLARELTAYAAEAGLRLEGPVEVSLEVRPVREVSCVAEVTPGSPPEWARLINDDTHIIRHNRLIVGRGSTSDVVLGHDDISRSHVLIWREQGKALIRDLSSTNGTRVDGQPNDGSPTVLPHGAVVNLSAHQYRFLLT